MGIEGIDNLHENHPEEYHVVIVGRAGGHIGTGIYLHGPGTKRLAIGTAEQNYRKENRFASNIALVSTVEFSGDKESAMKFMDRLMELIREVEDVS